MEALLAFGAALIALRLAGMLAARWRQRREPRLAFWARASPPTRSGRPRSRGAPREAGTPVSSASTTSSAGCSPRRCSARARWQGRSARNGPVGLLYAGLAAGVALAVPLEAPLSGTSIPEAQEHLALFPLRILAIVGNAAGSIALIGVAVRGFRRRPLGNGLLLAGFALAAAGSALAGLGTAQTAAFVAVAACLLYAGSFAPVTVLTFCKQPGC